MAKLKKISDDKSKVKQKYIQWLYYLDKIKAAQFSFGAKLPLALCVCVIQLPGELLRILVLTNLLGLVPKTGCLGCSGEQSTPTVSVRRRATTTVWLN